MSLDLALLREGIAATIRNGVSADVTCYEYLPAAPQFPCVVLRPAEDWIVPTESFPTEIAVTVNWDVLFGQTAQSEDAQRFLDRLVVEAIVALETTTSDGALDGQANDVQIGSVTMRSTGDPGADVWVAALRLSVLTSRTAGD
jgi:hypothetical protein